MRKSSLRPGDLVRANVRGYRFLARVEALDDPLIAGRPIRVEPQAPGVTFFHLTAREIRERLDPPRRTRRTHARDNR